VIIRVVDVNVEVAGDDEFTNCSSKGEERAEVFKKMVMGLH